MKPINKSVLQLAIPAIIANLSEPLLSLTDNYFISSLNSAAITGIGVSTSLIMAFFWILSSIKGAISSYIAQRLGEGKQDEINRVYPNLLLQLGIFALLPTFALFFYNKQILLLTFKVNPEVLRYASDYLSIRSFGLPFIMLSTGIFSVFRGLQNTKAIMLTVLISTIINIMLDYYMYHWGQAQFQLELAQGLAVATVCSQIFAFLISLILIRKITKPQLVLSRIPNTIIAYSKRLFVRTVFLNIVLILGQRYIQQSPANISAVHIVFTNLWLFCSYFMDGFADASLALSGKFKGENNSNSITALFNYSLKSNLIVACVLSLSLFLLGGLIKANLLANINSREIYDAHLFFFLSAIVIGALCFTTDGILTGLGKVDFLMKNMITAALSFTACLIFCSAISLVPLTSLWLAMSAWLLTRSVPALIKLKT